VTAARLRGLPRIERSSFGYTESRQYFLRPESFGMRSSEPSHRYFYVPALLSCGAALCFSISTSVAADELDANDWQVGPFVANYCLDCHQGDEPEGGTSLESLTGEARQTIDRKLWQAVVRNIEFQRMPPEDAEQPPAAARHQVVKQMQTRLRHIDCSGPTNPGQVTLRRLTRYEYRRTVKDLLGFDYAEVDDFPSDDIGHGFDNIGDVLTLSPLHYEKYLIAAEAIAASVVGIADGDFQFRIAGDGVEPTLGTHVDGDQHHMSSNADLDVAIRVPADGRYRMEVKLAPEQAGPNWVQADLLLDNKVVKSLELKAPSGTVGKHAFERRLRAGQHTLTIRYKNDYYQPRAANPGDRDRNLILHQVAVNGPFGSIQNWSDELNRFASLGNGEPVSTEEFVKRFLPRAYRREVTKTEVQEFVALINSVGGNRNDKMRMAIKVALVSPKFLYRVESAGAATDRADVRVLNDFDVANRLSYFLWSSMPDAWLMEEARAGRLRTDEQLKAVTKRMLADRRSTAIVLNFVDQWLQLRRLDELTKDTQLYPDFDAELLESMRMETQMFVASIVRSDRSVLDMLDADYTFIDGRLAQLYGLSKGDSDKFRKVSLKEGDRGGVLTQAAVLASTARPTRTSPVMRGKWILENILGDPPPPPAPGVDQLDEAQMNASASLREMLEQHRASKQCAACHAKMDALGFALEEFDAIGAKRDTDERGEPLDTTAEFPDGSKVAGAAELRRLLREAYADDFIRCLTEKLFTYAVGRQVEPFDECTLRAIVKKVRRDGDRFASIAEGVVLSDAFRRRSVSRQEATEPTP
jgi:hypothetical protein